MAFTGKRPYWTTITYGGTANPGIVSEEIFGLLVDSTTDYSFTATVEPTQNAASGATISLTFYNSSGTSVGSPQTANSDGTLAPGTQSQLSTTPGLAPAGTYYAIARIQWNGTPSTDNQLLVYDARVLNTNNSSQPPILNSNYAFFTGFEPWVAENDAEVSWVQDLLTSADGAKDSLVIDDSIELMGGPGGIQSQVAELQDANGNGAIFRIAAPGGNWSTGQYAQNMYDLGTPQPTQDIVESLLLDGERPYGQRSSNRTLALAIMIFATSGKTMRAAREYLMRVIDQDTFTITWTPADTGLPLVFDCFRAEPSSVIYGMNYDRDAGDGTQWSMTQINVQIPALPYGRSEETEEVDFTNGLIDGHEIPVATLADDYSTVESMQPYSDNGVDYGSNGGWRKNTTMKAGTSVPGVGSLMGVASAEYQPPTPMKMPWPKAIYKHTYAAPVNIVGRTVFSMWLGQSYDTQWPKAPTFVSNVRIKVALWDTQGRSIAFNINQPKCKWGANPNTPVWTWLSAAIPQDNPLFDYSNVATYQINIANWNSLAPSGYNANGKDGYVRMKAWMNGQIFAPASIMWDTTPRGSVYTMKGANGMARSPVSAQIELPATAPTSQEITKSGTWLVPTGVTSVMAEAWGGGGGGASASTNQAGGGGGGGEYAAETAISVTPGTKIPVTVGAGGTGAQLVSSSDEYTAPGTHKWVCPPNVDQVYAEVWGGGGAGTAGGGGGGGGEYARNETLTVIPGNTYTFVVGGGGIPNSGKSSAQNAARNGSVSQIVAEGVTVTAYGGKSPVIGGTNGGGGGNQSGAPVHYKGGNGGTSPGSAGGGGGASGGPTGAGANGGNSPSAGGYKKGGAGGGSTGNPNAGAGGAGATAPGTPIAGTAPGGGGGGGYTISANNNGAAGGAGMVRVSYKVNLGSIVNGGATTFGDTSSGLTNLNVTAHGGITATTNSASGAIGGGGTGNVSSNNTHYPGGAGGGGTAGTGGTDLNELIYGYGQQVLDNLKTFNGTGATFTSGASTVAEASGIAMLVITTSAALDSGHVIQDSAGNVYDRISSTLIPGGTAKLHIYRASVAHPITTATTISLSGNATSVTYTAMWLGSKYFESILEDSITPGTGTGTTATVQYTNPTPGTIIYELMVDANNGTATYSGNVAPGWGPAATNTAANGSQEISLWGQQVPGSSNPVTKTSTLSSSTGWVRIAVPMAALNQETQPMWLWTYNSATAGTSAPGSMSAAGPIDAGSGTVVLSVTTPAASTLTVTDSASNTYTLRSTTASSGGVTKIYTAPVTANLLGTSSTTVASTFGITDGTSQTHNATWYFLPNVSTYDTGAANTATGTGTSATVAGNTPAAPNEYVMGFVSANTASEAYTGATGWVAAQSNNKLSSNLSQAAFFKKQLGTTALSFSSTLSVSGAWNATFTAFALTQGTMSGGGGSSAGPNGAGRAAVGPAGGSAWADGGKGADGAQGSVVPGVSAGVPGGGGSGAIGSTSASEQGGNGGNGMVRLTWNPPLRTFNDFIIHRPAADTQARFLNPIVDIPPSDPPDSREYPVASLVDGVNAQFGGTYTVLLVNHSWDSPTTSRRVTVTVNQYEYKNGPVVSAQATKVVTPSTDITNGYVTMNELTLPIKDYDYSSTDAYYTVSVHDTNANDRFQDILFVDTMGQTVLCNIANGSAGDGQYHTYYIDEPDSNRALGRIMGTAAERDRSISVMDMTLATGGPLYINDADNTLVVYSTAGAPNLGITYMPRWYSDRMS